MDNLKFEIVSSLSCAEEGGKSWRAAMEERERGQLFKDLYELREDLGKCVVKN